MDRKEILSKIQTIICEKLKIVSEKILIQESTDLKRDYNIDSLRIVNLIVEIENVFNIEMDSDDISQEILTNIKQLINFLEKFILN